MPVGTTPQVNSCSVTGGSDNRHCDGGGVGIELFPREDVRCPEEAGVGKGTRQPTRAICSDLASSPWPSVGHCGATMKSAQIS